MKHVTIRQALEAVANNPQLPTDELTEVPVHDLVCRTLFDIANNPDAGERGAMTRANKARKMLLDRMVGLRRAGSHPATKVNSAIKFVDLTGGELE